MLDGQHDVAGIEGVEPQAGGVRRRVVADAADVERGAVAGEPVVGNVGHRVDGGGAGGQHVVVEHDADLAHRQRHQGAIGRRHPHHLGRHQRRHHVHLLAVGHQQAAIGGGDQLLGARAANGQFHLAQRDQVHQVQAGAGFTGAAAAAGKQQVFEGCAGLGEGDGIEPGVEVHLHLRPALRIEADQVTTLGPGAGPQRAVGRHGQVIDPHVAEVGEAALDRVEAVDAGTRRHVEHTLDGVEGQRLGDAVAIAVQDLQCAGIQLKQRTTARGGPQPALGVVGQVVDRRIELHLGRQHAATVLVEQVERAAVATARDDEVAVRPLQHRQRADASKALGDAGAEGRTHKRCQHRRELRRRAGLQRRHTQLGLLEQRIGRRRHAGRGRDAHIHRGAAHAGRAAQVGARAIVGHGHHRWAFAVAGVVGGQRQKLNQAPGRADVQARAGRGLALPDGPVTALHPHIDGGVAHARAAWLFGDGPADLVVAPAGHHLAGNDGGHRWRGVQPAGDGVGVDRRLVVHQHAGLRVDLRTALRAKGAGHAVADETTALALGVVGRQQAAGGCLQHLAGFGIDGLQHPAGDAGGGIDARRHPDDETQRLAEVEIALVVGAVRRHRDVDAADLQVAQAEAARTQARIELGNDAHLVGRSGGLGRVLEAHGVGQLLARGHVLLAAEALRATDRRSTLGLHRLLQQGLQGQWRDVAVGRHRGVVRQRHVGIKAQPGRVDVESLEVGGVRQAEVEVLELGQRRDRDVVLAAVVRFAVIVARQLGHLAGRVAVPLVHLGEKRGQAGRALDGLARRADQHAGRQDAQHRDHLRVAPDRRRLVNRPQQAAVFQRGQIGGGPGGSIGRQVDQRRVGGGIGQDRAAQALGLGRLLGHKLGAGHRRGGRHHVEAERDEEDGALVGHFHRRVVEEIDHVSEDPAGAERTQAAGQGVGLGHVGPGVVERALEGLEVTVGQRFQAWVGGHAEAHADVAPGADVQRVAGGQHPAVAVDFGIQAGPGHVGALAVVGRAAQVGIEGEERQAVDLGVVADIGRGEAHLDVGRVDVGQALQRDAVQPGLAGRQHPRAAQADGDVDRHRAFNQVAVGQHCHLAIGVDHCQVIQAVRLLAQVPDRDDGGGVDHLVAGGLDFGDARAHQLDQRTGLEAGAGDGGGHPAAVAALVLLDVGDRERQRLHRQRHRHVAAGARAALHQHVVVTRQRGRDQRGRAGRQRVDRTGIEGKARRHVAIAHVDLVGHRRVGRGQLEAQRLVARHGDAEQLLFTRRQRERLRHAQAQFGHGDGDHVGRCGLVVALVDAFVHLVEDVAAHDDAVLPGLGRGQRGQQLGGVAGTGGQPAAMAHLAQQHVAEIPGGVARQVQRIGPRTGGIDSRRVGDGEAHGHRCAAGRQRRQVDVAHHQVGRRRQLDQHRVGRGGGVVVFGGGLEHLATRLMNAAGHVGAHKDVVRADQVTRQPEVSGHAVAGTHGQRAVVHHLSEVAVGGGVEEGIGRQVDVVDPAGHAGGRATEVAHGVAQVQHLAGFYPLGRHHGGDAQVGGRAQRDVDRPYRGVVALVSELGHTVLAEPHLTDLDRRCAAQVGQALDVGVGEGDQVERAVGVARQREGGRALVAGPGGQLAISRKLGNLQVARVERRVARQIQAVVPERFTRLTAALVGHREGDADRLP